MPDSAYSATVRFFVLHSSRPMVGLSSVLYLPVHLSGKNLIAGMFFGPKAVAFSSTTT